jgi:PAS domain-containing protein
VPQHPVEVILTKQLASYLAMPIFLVGPGGDLLYYNEPAEQLLGCRFDETGEMDLAVWSDVFTATDDAGDPLAADRMPLVIAVQEQRPAQDDFWIIGLDGVKRHLSVTAVPLLAQDGRNVGAVALFWEAE